MFVLAYSVSGFTVPVENMTEQDREWFAERLGKQKKLEAELLKKATRKPKR